jgi:hypothetical protein
VTPKQLMATQTIGAPIATAVKASGFKPIPQLHI